MGDNDTKLFILRCKIPVFKQSLKSHCDKEGEFHGSRYENKLPKHTWLELCKIR